MAKESYLYKKLKGKKHAPYRPAGSGTGAGVQCRACAHYCFVLPKKRGVCGVRENIDGKLYVLNYGKLAAANIDPIEKKPLFHFLPGTFSYSIAAVGCNFSCLACQNWALSQAPKIPHAEFGGNALIFGRDQTPEEIVEDAIKYNCPSISYTYTEPTIFLEFALDCMKIAKKRGLKNIWVSNGFMSEEAAKLIIPYLDANNVDIKGFSDKFYKEVCGGRLQPVLDTAKIMKKSDVWVEITTLVIPTLSDDKKTLEGIAKFIFDELGPETPWHISRFSGAISWKLQNLPETSVKTLEMAYEIGKEAGLKYVYTGNIPGLPSENTFCPKCNTLAIERTNYIIHRHDKKGKCPKCGGSLNLILK